MSYRAYLFEMDGTLLDSAPTLAAFANEVLTRHGYPAQPLETLLPRAGRGAAALLAPAGAEALAPYFLAHYRETSPLFPGVAALLARLPRWGIVSSKPRALLAEALHRHKLKPAVLIGREDVAAPKPDPEGLRRACATLGVAPAEALYVGDESVDAEAAAAAGLDFVRVGPTGLAAALADQLPAEVRP